MKKRFFSLYLSGLILILFLGATPVCLTEGNAMKILFTRSGGFAAIKLNTEVDASTLSPAEANQLQKLIADADFFNLPERILSNPPQSDRYQYQLTINNGSLSHTVIVSENSMPTQLRPLIEWLTHSARSL